jgi:hypothetical protein
METRRGSGSEHQGHYKDQFESDEESDDGSSVISSASRRPLRRKNRACGVAHRTCVAAQQCVGKKPTEPTIASRLKKLRLLFIVIILSFTTLMQTFRLSRVTMDGDVPGQLEGDAEGNLRGSSDGNTDTENVTDGALLLKNETENDLLLASNITSNATDLDGMIQLNETDSSQLLSEEQINKEPSNSTLLNDSTYSIGKTDEDVISEIDSKEMTDEIRDSLANLASGLTPYNDNPGDSAGYNSMNGNMNKNQDAMATNMNVNQNTMTANTANEPSPDAAELLRQSLLQYSLANNNGQNGYDSNNQQINGVDSQNVNNADGSSFEAAQGNSFENELYLNNAAQQQDPSLQQKQQLLLQQQLLQQQLLQQQQQQPQQQQQQQQQQQTQRQQPKKRQKQQQQPQQQQQYATATDNSKTGAEGAESQQDLDSVKALLLLQAMANKGK